MGEQFTAAIDAMVDYVLGTHTDVPNARPSLA